MKIKFRTKLLIIIFLTIFLAAAGFGDRAVADNLSSLENFQDILYLIENYYVEEKDMDELMDGAIKGMIEELDSYSSYMSPEEYEEMQVEFEGTFGGIGIVITTRKDKLTIVSPIKGTPGDRADLEAGDVITAINGESTDDMSQKKAVDMMRGEPGTRVTLTIDREQTMEPFDLEIVRDDIEIPYVEHEMKTEEIGYISVAQFAEDVGKKVGNSLEELKEEGARGVILDLRSNPGGMLEEAINVTSNFIKGQQTVVSIKQRNDANKTMKTNPDIEKVDLQLIVMINKGSASASEIVAGAIRDYNRGKLVGTPSFGKGTVQTVIPLNDGSALRLTTARYYTPEGTFIHEQGIEPDIEVEYDPEAETDTQLEKALELMESFLYVEEFIKNRAS
ncbi:MAG: S41 family peptidase [Bacillota bacterium]